MRDVAAQRVLATTKMKFDTRDAEMFVISRHLSAILRRVCAPLLTNVVSATEGSLVSTENFAVL